MSRTDHHLPYKYREDIPFRDIRFVCRINGSSSMTMLANRLERRARAAARSYAVLVVRVSRSSDGLAGPDGLDAPDRIDDIPEPDGRPRHAAHWLFW